MSNMIIAVDFDGTIVTHAYPKIGRPVPGALRVLRRLLDQDVKLILWTMRSGDTLDEAVHYLNNEGISLWGINTNPEQGEWTDSPKAYASLYIDDAALGCPTLPDKETGRRMVNWRQVEGLLERAQILISR